MKHCADRLFAICSARFAKFDMSKEDVEVLTNLCNAYGYLVDHYANGERDADLRAEINAQISVYNDFIIYKNIAIEMIFPDEEDKFESETCSRRNTLLKAVCDYAGGGMEVDEEGDE